MHESAPCKVNALKFIQKMSQNCQPSKWAKISTTAVYNYFGSTPVQ